MSISNALSSALSGLSASSRSADVVAANLANVATDGYARREVVLGSNAVGGGVTVESIARIVDEAALADRRAADGNRALAQSQIDFLVKAADAVGEP
jgi:flagellar hook-associated protein 1 FlgK